MRITSVEQAVAEGWFTPNPSGLCLCGCGETAPVAKCTSRHHGTLRGEHKRYVRGHYGTGGIERLTVEQGIAEGWFTPNRNGGLCECGCGEPAPLSEHGDRRHGYVKGEPMHYLPEHWAPGGGTGTPAFTVEQAKDWYLPNTNDGYCMCGCGERTKLAPSSRRAHGWVKGQPVRFRRNHDKRGIDPNITNREKVPA